MKQHSKPSAPSKPAYESKRDAVSDAKQGIKENSRKDNAQDKKGK